MIKIRKASERGHFNHGWLDTCHSFSFATYQDPAHMGFRSLRVINEDIIEPDQGFSTHPHRDMEIITYVISGELKHKDNTGSGSVIRHGEVQHMSAGTGIRHSEFNPSTTTPVHLLQIWIMPNKNDLPPCYEQKGFSDRLRPGELCLIASTDGRDNSVIINQDVNIYTCKVLKDHAMKYPIQPNRHMWLQLISGSLRVDADNSDDNGDDGQTMSAGDGCAVSNENELSLVSLEDSEFLLFDLA